MNLSDTQRGSRGAALTPMVDVVFILLIFFILVARFGPDEAIELSLGAGGVSAIDAPRLIDVGASDLRLNGFPITGDQLAGALENLGLESGDLILLRPGSGVDLQRMVDVIGSLRILGYANAAILEAGP